MTAAHAELVASQMIVVLRIVSGVLRMDLHLVRVSTGLDLLVLARFGRAVAVKALALA